MAPNERGDELPEGLGRWVERLKRLGEAKARLERESPEKAQTAREHIAQRQTEEVDTGKKKRGRAPEMVGAVPAAEAKANVADPDSRIMKTRYGYVQGHNTQAIASQNQITVAVRVTLEANDVQQLKPMLKTAERALEAAGTEERPRAALAAAGYWSEANAKVCSHPEEPELLIATTGDWRQRKALTEKGCPRGVSQRS